MTSTTFLLSAAVQNASTHVPGVSRDFRYAPIPPLLMMIQPAFSAPIPKFRNISAAVSIEFRVGGWGIESKDRASSALGLPNGSPRQAAHQRARQKYTSESRFAAELFLAQGVPLERIDPMRDKLECFAVKRKPLTGIGSYTVVGFHPSSCRASAIIDDARSGEHIK